MVGTDVEVKVLRNLGAAFLMKTRALAEGALRADARITLKPPR